MLKRLTKRVRSDDGDSTLVSTIIVIPLLIMMFFTIIDLSIWFNNRSILNGIARDGARTVAIMGGTSSPLASDYAVDVEQNLENTLMNEGAGLINVQFAEEDGINCGPVQTGEVGEETFCEIDWEYGGIGLSAFRVLANNSDDADARSALNWNKTRGTAESEVRF